MALQSAFQIFKGVNAVCPEIIVGLVHLFQIADFAFLRICPGFSLGVIIVQQRNKVGCLRLGKLSFYLRYPVEQERDFLSDVLDNGIGRLDPAVEITLGMVILIACIVSGIGMVAMTDMNKLFGDPAYLQARMSSACLIIIGIELIKMITSYTIDSVVDVMLLAIARQMIVEHTSPQENLLAVLSVGVLFVIRKFLYISRLDKRRELERKKKEDKQKGSVPSPAAENAEASAAEPLQSDEMRKRDEFHIDEELEELERLKAAVERKAEEELRRIEQMEKNVIH